MFPWNARAVLMNKMENPTPQNEFKMTYDYFHVAEKFSETHMKLMSKCHDYFSDFRHGCYMTVDLKHAYFIVEVHSDDKKYFAFTISKLD